MKKFVLSVLAALVVVGVSGGVAAAQESGVEAASTQSSSQGAIWG